MRRISVFNQISLDGYFAGPGGDIGWAHQQKPDPELRTWVEGNAQGESLLVFGRKTYEMMASFWPTPLAAQQMPAVAEGMNRAPKIVFSRTLREATWSHTHIERDLDRIQELKAGDGPALVIMGSGTLVAELTRRRLIDEYQVLVYPVVLGAGRTMFEGLDRRMDLELVRSRTFPGGAVSLVYARGG